jgi:hypothetical protein
VSSGGDGGCGVTGSVGIGGRGRPQPAAGAACRARRTARNGWGRQREPLRSGPECIRFGIWGGVCASSLCAECAVFLHMLR